MALTKQQMAEGIYDWFFVKGNTQALRGKTETDKRCMYRGPNGTKCAVGCLIPDEMYLPEMESSGDVYSIIRSYKNIATYLNAKYNIDFLEQCQKWHDRHFNNHTYLKDVFVENEIDITNMPLLLTQQ